MALAQRLRRFKRHPSPGDMARLSISDPTLTVGVSRKRRGFESTLSAKPWYLSNNFSVLRSLFARRAPATALSSFWGSFLSPDPDRETADLKRGLAFIAVRDRPARTCVRMLHQSINPARNGSREGKTL
jgi:hypothetical protein